MYYVNPSWLGSPMQMTQVGMLSVSAAFIVSPNLIGSCWEAAVDHCIFYGSKQRAALRVKDNPPLPAPLWVECLSRFPSPIRAAADFQ